jgi:hypothetical protein
MPRIRRVRRYKVRPVFRQRNKFGEMRLVGELYSSDREIFVKSFRMLPEHFDYLLNELQQVKD